jgi:hypothetical protein
MFRLAPKKKCLIQDLDPTWPHPFILPSAFRSGSFNPRHSMLPPGDRILHTSANRSRIGRRTRPGHPAITRTGHEMLRTADGPGPSKSAPPLLDKRALAHALGVSTATVDRLCRHGRVPYVHVGDVRRFDLDAVRSALRVHGPGPIKAQTLAREPGPDAASARDVRLLSRSGRR